MTHAAVTLLLPFGVGALLLQRAGLAVSRDPLSRAGYAWLVGSLAVASGVFVASLSGLSPQHWVWFAPLVGLAFGQIAIVLARARAGEPSQATVTLGLPFGLFVLGLLGLCALRFVAAGATPTIDTDEAAIWTLKAKVQVLYPMLSEDYRRGLGDVLHSDYPLLNPLLHAWSYAVGGRIELFASRQPIQLYFVALLLVGAGAFRRLVPAWSAALLLLVLATDEVFRVYSVLGHADVMVAAGWLLAFDAWLRWREDGARAWMLLGGCGIATALWSKNEALLHTLVIAGIVTTLALTSSLRARRWPNWKQLCGTALSWWWPGLIAVLLGLAVNATFDLKNDLVDADGSSLPALFLAQFRERVPVVLAHAWRELFSAPAAGGLIGLPVVALLIPHTWWPRETLRLPTIALALSLAGLLAVYVGSLHDVEWHLDTSLRRVLFQLAPSTCLWLALFAQNTWWPRRGTEESQS